MDKGVRVSTRAAGKYKGRITYSVGIPVGTSFALLVVSAPIVATDRQRLTQCICRSIVILRVTGLIEIVVVKELSARMAVSHSGRAYGGFDIIEKIDTTRRIREIKRRMTVLKYRIRYSDIDSSFVGDAKMNSVKSA